MAQPKKARFGFPYLWTILGFCLVAGLALLLRPSAPDTSYDEKRKQERLHRLDALKKEEAATLTSYGWVNKEKGIARIPLEAAMQLALNDLQNRKPAASEIKAEPISTSLIPPYLQPAAAAGSEAPAADSEAPAAAPAATSEAPATSATEASAPEAGEAAPASSEAPATEAPASEAPVQATPAPTPAGDAAAPTAPSAETANPSVQ